VPGDNRDELARVGVDRSGEVTRIDLAGELDMSNAAAIFDQLSSASAGESAVQVDLGGLSFIDSAGIALLDRLNRALAGTGTTLRFVAPAGSTAARTLSLTGMDQVLPMADLEDP
jgi:anti-sigma B factor antagonist